MAQIGDRNYIPFPKVFKRGVRELPVIPIHTQPSPMNRRSVAQVRDSQVPDAIKVRAPVLVMPAFLHLIDPRSAAVDRRITVLDSRRKQEQWQHRPEHLRISKSPYKE